jgi:hypothetical protein
MMGRQQLEYLGVSNAAVVQRYALEVIVVTEPFAKIHVE